MLSVANAALFCQTVELERLSCLHNLIIFLVASLELRTIAAETIVDVLEVLCHIHSERVILRDVICLLKWLKSILERYSKLNSYDGLILAHASYAATALAIYSSAFAGSAWRSSL